MNLDQTIDLQKMISKSTKEYTNEEDLRDNEVPNYEELCMLEVVFYNEHDNKQEANAAEKELEIYDQKYVS